MNPTPAETVVMHPAPVETFVRARRLGIVFRLGDQGEIFATLPEGMTQAPAWLREAKQAEPEGLAFAVALGLALERGGGDAGALLEVRTLEFPSRNGPKGIEGIATN